MKYNTTSDSPDPACVFICPLDWGLGHATRIIPLIYNYVESGYRVILGGTGNSGDLLRHHFSKLPFIEVPSYAIRYPAIRFLLVFYVILQLPLFTFGILKEHFLLKKIIKTHKVNIVLSDNRYGMFSKTTHNIIVTHQLSPVLPLYLRPAQYLLHLMIRFLVTRFDECWIPDYPGNNNLTGKLSHHYRLPRNASFIGPLSRFSHIVAENSESAGYDLVITLSGQQPELGKFTRQVLNQVSELTIKTLVLTGLQKDTFHVSNRNVTIMENLDGAEFRKVLVNAGMIICRSGYSSIMDLVALGKTALLIPTPGQPEQEYLAEWLKDIGMFQFICQSDLNLKTIEENYLRMKTTSITANPSKNPM